MRTDSTLSHAASCTAGLFAASLSFAGAIAGSPEPLSVPGLRGQDTPKARPERRVEPFSKRLGIDLGAVFPVATLPPLDVARLCLQDDQRIAGPQAMRVGVCQHAAVRAQHTAPIRLPDGRTLWTLDIRVTGAEAVRVHFIGLDLPPGAEMVAYAPDRPESIDGPFRGTGAFRDGDEWSMPITGEDVRIECLMPAAPDGGIEPPRFWIDEVLNLYREGPWSAAAGGGERGDCFLDVTCEPDWADQTRGVGYYTFVRDGSAFTCTGTLINCREADYSPFFLTARHCVDTDEVARTVGIYWRYQSIVCDGEPTPLNRLYHTKSAVVVDSGSGADATLLLLDGKVHRGSFWSGWMTDSGGADTNVVNISHPRGLPMTYADGEIGGLNICRPFNSFRVRWNEDGGGTDGGSSGSACFRADTGSLVGVLSCGSTACIEDAHDEFGSFNAIYDFLEDDLDTAGDDFFEIITLDACATGTLIPPLPDSGAFPGMIVKYQDEDWFVVHMDSLETFHTTLEHDESLGNIDIELYEGCGTLVDFSNSDSEDTEGVEFTNFGPAQDYLLRVYLADDVRATYDISWRIQPAMNDPCTDRIRIREGTFYGDNSNATEDGSACILRPAGTAQDLWYEYTASDDAILDVRVCAAFDSIVSIHSSCPGTNSNILACGPGCSFGPCTGSFDACVSLAVTEGTRYLIRVDGEATGEHGPFSLTTGLRYPAVNNDAYSGAEPLAMPLTTGTTNGADNDFPSECGHSDQAPDVWYTFTPPCPGTLAIDSCGSELDTVLSIYDSTVPSETAQIACNDDWCGWRSRVSVHVLPGDPLLVRVSGYDANHGDFILNSSFTPDAALNDRCANALAITDGVYDFDTCGATTDGPPEPARCNFRMSPEIEADIWFRYTAPCTGMVSAALCQSSYDTEIAVYGPNCPTVADTVIACNDNQCMTRSAIMFLATSGLQYLIRVGGYLGATGPGRLVVSCTGVPECRCDFNHDASLNSQDFFDFLACFFAACPGADFNNNGSTNSQDFFDFLACFFAPPSGCP